MPGAVSPTLPWLASTSGSGPGSRVHLDRIDFVRESICTLLDHPAAESMRAVRRAVEQLIHFERVLAADAASADEVFLRMYLGHRALLAAVETLQSASDRSEMWQRAFELRHAVISHRDSIEQARRHALAVRPRPVLVPLSI